MSCSAPCNQLFQKNFFECFYNYLELSKKVSFIFLSQILTDLEICLIAFLYISLVISGVLSCLPLVCLILMCCKTFNHTKYVPSTHIPDRLIFFSPICYPWHKKCNHRPRFRFQGQVSSARSFQSQCNASFRITNLQLQYK